MTCKTAKQKKEEAAQAELAKGQTQALGGHYQVVPSLETEGENSDLHANTTNAKSSSKGAEGKSTTSQEEVLQSNKPLSAKPVFYENFAHAHEQDIILEVQAVDTPFLRGGVRFSLRSSFIVVDDNHQSKQSKNEATYVSVGQALRIYKEAQNGKVLKLLRTQNIEELEKHA